MDESANKPVATKPALLKISAGGGVISFVPVRGMRGDRYD